METPDNSFPMSGSGRSRRSQQADLQFDGDLLANLLKGRYMTATDLEQWICSATVTPHLIQWYIYITNSQEHPPYTDELMEIDHERGVMPMNWYDELEQRLAEESAKVPCEYSDSSADVAEWDAEDAWAYFAYQIVDNNQDDDQPFGKGVFMKSPRWCWGMAIKLLRTVYEDLKSQPDGGFFVRLFRDPEIRPTPTRFSRPVRYPQQKSAQEGRAYRIHSTSRSRNQDNRVDIKMTSQAEGQDDSVIPTRSAVHRGTPASADGRRKMRLRDTSPAKPAEYVFLKITWLFQREALSADSPSFVSSTGKRLSERIGSSPLSSIDTPTNVKRARMP